MKKHNQIDCCAANHVRFLEWRNTMGWHFCDKKQPFGTKGLEQENAILSQSEQRAAVGMDSARNKPDVSCMISRRVRRPWPCCFVWMTGEPEGVFGSSNFFTVPPWISLNVEETGDLLFFAVKVPYGHRMP